MRLIVRQIYLINFYLDRFLLDDKEKKGRNWSINGFLDGKKKENIVDYTEDNLRIEEYIFDDGASKKFSFEE